MTITKLRERVVKAAMRYAARYERWLINSSWAIDEPTPSDSFLRDCAALTRAVQARKRRKR